MSEWIGICRHCDKPIEWSRDFQAWLHIHTQFKECIDLHATPKEAP